VETDLIVRARRDGQEVWVAVEVSSTVDVQDVERAAESAASLARIFGAPAVAAVAGRGIGPAAAAAAHDRGVLILSQA
jgi:DNA-binding beta-propeller fold protein YncE